MFHFFSNLGSFVNSGSSFTVGYLLSELSPQSRRENTMGTPVAFQVTLQRPWEMGRGHRGRSLVPKKLCEEDSHPLPRAD